MKSSSNDGLRQACGVAEGEPGFVGAIQTFGDLIGWHSPVHAVANEGLFRRDDSFLRIVHVDIERCTEAWRDRAFDLLLREEKIDDSYGLQRTIQKLQDGRQPIVLPLL